MAYPPIFWDRVQDVFVFYAVSEGQIAFDLGLDRKHLREIAQKMEWKKIRTKPRITELKRRMAFYMAHTMERKRLSELKADLKYATEAHNRLVEIALLFKHCEFDGMASVNAYLKKRGIELTTLLTQRYQKRIWGDDHTRRRDRRPPGVSGDD
jgi:hypothetical protein